MDFCVFTLGCRVNQYEGHAIIKRIKERGFTAADRPVAAGCYVINTCSVTAEADKKSRQAVARLKRLNENARIIIIGCAAEKDARVFAAKDGVFAVSGAAGKLDFIDGLLDGKISQKINAVPPPALFESVRAEKPARKSRAYIKVQDGCDDFCSYCVVPYLRGRSRSRPLPDIMDEAEENARRGAAEIVFCGINLSSYGRDIGADLAGLVGAAASIAAPKRLSSLHPDAINTALLTAMARGGFSGDFHLSLQSCCDGVLKAMNRGYTLFDIQNAVDMIKSYYPSHRITADIIAGFPTETEEDFAKTFDALKALDLDGLHIFPYSPRPGTAADKLKPLPRGTVKERADKLKELKKRGVSRAPKQGDIK